MNKIIAGAAIMLSLSACATVTRGTKEAMVIETDPIGAQVTISNAHMGGNVTCTTPCSIEMPRKHGFAVTIEKDGYETVETKIITKVEGAGSAGMAGNVLVGGLIGAGVDAATGAMLGFSPNPLTLKMIPVTAETESDDMMLDGAQDDQEIDAETGS